jgi:hypothetical protein
VTDTGLLDAPAAEIWTLPVYVPAPRPVGETSTESVDGAVPDAAATDSHVALVVALQLSVPPPLFVIWMDCAAGIVPPTVQANWKLAGVTTMVGDKEAAMMLMESHADDDNST